jgi:hypothetical protein
VNTACISATLSRSGGLFVSDNTGARAAAGRQSISIKQHAVTIRGMVRCGGGRHEGSERMNERERRKLRNRTVRSRCSHT